MENIVFLRKVCLKFSYFLSQLLSSLEITVLNQAIQKPAVFKRSKYKSVGPSQDLDEKKMEKILIQNGFEKQVQTFQRDFKTGFSSFFEKLTTQTQANQHIATLVLELDFNDFYSQNQSN